MYHDSVSHTLRGGCVRSSSGGEMKRASSNHLSLVLDLFPSVDGIVGIALFVVFRGHDGSRTTSEYR